MFILDSAFFASGSEFGSCFCSLPAFLLLSHSGNERGERPTTASLGRLQTRLKLKFKTFFRQVASCCRARGYGLDTNEEMKSKLIKCLVKVSPFACSNVEKGLGTTRWREAGQ